MTTKYHNARILSIQHLPEQDKLLVRFADHDDWEIDSVVDFSFNGFYPQNILFHVTEYRWPTCRPKSPPNSPCCPIICTAAKNGRFSICRRRPG